MKIVKIIGMGISPEDLTAEHLEIIEKADILVGGKRLLEQFADCAAQKEAIDKNIDRIIDFIKDRMATRSIVVLASGDPLFFGIGARLVKALGSENVVIYPNVSAVAAGFARIKEPWSNVRVVSLHGRDNERVLFKALETENVVAVFTDPNNNPARMARRLLEEELSHFSMCVLESLGTSAERFEWYRPDQAAAMTFAEPNLVVLKRSHHDTGLKQPFYLGMPESCYDHQQGLITKSEIRAITISKLRLLKDHILWDLGAGSGSVAIEASLLVPEGKVFAVEKKTGRIEQIKSNKSRFGVPNIEVVQAMLPEGLERLPRPDRVFIGGGGRDLAGIIDAAARFLKPDGIIVVNTVLIQNTTAAMDALRALGFKTSCVQIQIGRSREMPWGDRLDARNPVWIVTGRGK
jgi:precorrin-6Y C5,15-methyltransferase (decarboxylating)